MDIIVDGKVFVFSDQSIFPKRESLYDLEIVEPGFDEGSEKMIGGGTSKPIILPKHLMFIVRRTELEPCSVVFEDKNGNKKLSAYFD